MPNRVIKNTFNAGELSETLAGRTDLSKYFNGCSELVNGIVMPQGGVNKRPGTRFVAKGKGAFRLFPFEFSADDVMVIEMGNLYMRFFKDKDRVMTDSVNLSDDAVSISAFADYSGTVAGTVKATTSAVHGLITGDYVTIAGTTSYNGVFKVTVIDTDDFYFTDTWVANDATGTVTLKGVYLPSGSVIQIGATSHGFSTGDVVRFTNAGGATELNYNGNQATEWTITKVNNNSFTLDGTDGDDFTAYTSGGTVAAIYEIVSPYALADLFDIHYQQSADVIYFHHEDYYPQKLSRLADNSWTIADDDIENGPFLPQNTDTDNTLTYTETNYTGSATADHATVMTTAETFVVDALIGMTIYNLIDCSYGVITDNDEHTVTVAALLGGTDNEWDNTDTFLILDSNEIGYYHGAGESGVLTATGHSPFLSSHVGSIWKLTKTRLGDNYTVRSGTLAAGTSDDVLVKGEVRLDAIGFSDSATTTVTLQRKVNDGDWQDIKKFTSAVSYSTIESEDNVYYRFVVSGTVSATTNVTLTASNQISNGIVEIDSINSATSANVTVIKDVFRDVVQDISFTSFQGNSGITGVVRINKVGHGLSNGDRIIFKGIENTSYDYLNYNSTDNNFYVVGNKNTDYFFLCGTNGAGGNAAEQTTGLGEYYVTDEITTTSEWAEGAWSEYRGYPKTSCFYEDRHWRFGTTNNPQTLWGSKSSQYTNYEEGSLDDDAIVYTINDSDVSGIQWAVADELLMIGTANKEYKVSASNVDDPITPSDIKARPQSSYGSSGIQPVVMNNSIFYFQGQGRKLRAMRFQDTTLKFESDDATLLASHMLEKTPIQCDYQLIPDAILWVLREDGTLCPFSYEPKEEVAAWARIVTGSTLYEPVGKFKTVAVTRGSVEDDIYVGVERIVDGSTVYYIEVFAPRLIDSLGEALVLDCAKEVTQDFTAKNITYASDTVRYGAGLYGSGSYGVV